MKIPETLRRILFFFSKFYCKLTNKLEYQLQKHYKFNERIIEYQFIFNVLKDIYPKTLLDVGTGTTALPHLLSKSGINVTAIDNIYDYWPKGMFNRHFHVINSDITKVELNQKFDVITCISVLEHISKFNDAIDTMITYLKPNGHLILTFPYNENKYIANVYDLDGASYGQKFKFKCQVFSRNELNLWLQKHKCRIIKQEYWQVFTGDFWTIGRSIYPPKLVNKDEKHQITCILLKKM
ncbi:MAG: class I SAM-dependent methyltransferase [Promethearchaeota archaeon]